MRYKFFANLLLSTLVSSIACLALFADYLPAYKPKLCPSIGHIKAASLNNTEKAAWLGWSAKSSKNSFGTNDEWMLVVPIGNAQDALAQATIIQSKLIKALDVAPVKDGALWICRYSIGDNNQMYAWTITPVLSDEQSE